MDTVLTIANAILSEFYYLKDPSIQEIKPVKLVKKTPYYGIVENISGKKTIVSLAAKVFITHDAVKNITIDSVENKLITTKKVDKRTHIFDTIDSLLLNAPEGGYTVRELITIIIKSSRSSLTPKQLLYVIHSRIWRLRKFKGFENIAPKRHYKLIKILIKEDM